MPELLTWPHPPHFIREQPGVSGQAEPCLVILDHGVESLGTLAAFVPNDHLCRVTLQGDPAPRDIAFGGLRSLRLRRPLAIRRPQTVLDAIASVAPVQSCLVNFQDGGTLTGETVGYVEDDAGLFIFMPLGRDAVERYFFPRHAIRSYQIGELLGETLIENQAASRDDVEAALNHQRTLRVQLLGEGLADNKVVRRDQLVAALKRQQSMPLLKLGEALRQLDLITESQLQEALTRQAENRRLRVGHILIKMGVIDENGLKRALAQKLGIPFIDISKADVELTAASLVEEEFARSHFVLPLCIQDGMLIVAMDDPLDEKILKALRFKAQMHVAPVTAQRESIVAAIDASYGKPGSTSWDRY